MTTLLQIPIEEIRQARQRLQGLIVRTPLLPLDLPESQAEIYLKLETLQPIGSFKIRGAGNAMLLTSAQELAGGVYTASAGNMAQGVAWAARRMGIPCTVIVPDHAPETKTDAVVRLGAQVIRVPFDDWWRVIVNHQYPGQRGRFIHPVSDPAVIAGNGTIGLEILEDLPEVDTVVVPFGGGGLSCGIASVFQALQPRTRILAAEVATAAPLSAALKQGKPARVEYHSSFVDGIGSTCVLEEMWPLVRSLVKESLVCSLEEVARAVRLLAERKRIIAEGAGAASVAAALQGGAGSGKVVCIVSGGNIDFRKLIPILSGDLP